MTYVVSGRCSTVRLIVISNESYGGRALQLRRIGNCCRLARPGTVLVVMRDPELSVRARLELGASLRQLTRETGQYLSVRDRLDVALLVESDGVHLAENSILPERVREVTRESFFISRAHHALERTPPVGVDAVLVSPVCAPRKNNPAIGIEGFGAFARRHPSVRCFALGGVGDVQASDCLRVGGAGVAAIGAVLSTDDPRSLLSALGILGDALAT